MVTLAYQVESRDGWYGNFQKRYGIYKNTSVSLNTFYTCNQEKKVKVVITITS